MSRHLHRNSDRQRRDRDIQDELENLEYEVFTIPASNLSDRTSTTKQLFRIGRILLGKK
ncbi:hypothetical protein [Myxosarcina sp. GI1(2024)]